MKIGQIYERFLDFPYKKVENFSTWGGEVPCGGCGSVADEA